MGHTLDTGLRAGLILACIAYLILGYPAYQPLPQITAQADAWLLNTAGIHAVSDSRYLVASFHHQDYIYELSYECCGLILFAIYIIVIFLIPKFSYKHRAVALLFLPLIFFGNILRIALGVMVGYHVSVDASIFFHDTFGQILIFIWIIACFLAWLKLTHNFPTEPHKVLKL
jgi:exosortase/archaeosortase family protein